MVLIPSAFIEVFFEPVVEWVVNTFKWPILVVLYFIGCGMLITGLVGLFVVMMEGLAYIQFLLP